MATHITPRLPTSPPSSPMRPETAQYRQVPGGEAVESATANEEGYSTSSDTEVEYPDTPTPLTNWQKRSAYLDLGTPTPPSVTNSKGSAKPKASSSSLRKVAAPVPLLPVRPVHPMQETTQEEADKERKDLEDEIAQFSRESSAQGIPMELQRFKRSGEDAAVITKNAYKLQPHQARRPYLSRVPATTSTTMVRERPVFSIPGRDEYERKKITLEADDGPFAQAISMHDLNRSRRIINEEVDARAPARPDWKEDMMCGCVLM
ncbi:hypothetical protein PtrSN002B_010330 [Pyrenophora tritici-repentis]|nr:hypothetical protein A1F94_011955 [Pyrenophora tritici-repentis]KAI0607682.1 hypothetical protein TUN205_08084 [Pyrenophora tritici-repentis]KAI1525904.1 hypothetical protein PtrSN001A_010190 [Pyrenophora tritici-repentis]KAI1526528.1 hypothetical protein PtrSN001C_010205 [Pyrenophora tritici-repentis]KAI1533584.1 hypothetical protein PtrSN002B_010330 [Pyrenophora tritici-repentis]